MAYSPRSDIVHLSTKTYTHSVGLSCCFRQWRARSHCRFLHGYALEIKFVFAAQNLDENGWVVDFGALKPLKTWLENTFDHKLLVASDDPYRDKLCDLARGEGYNRDIRVAQVHIVDAVGCEAFARMIFDYTEQWMIDYDYSPRVVLVEVEVREHGANSAVCRRLQVQIKGNDQRDEQSE